MTDDQIIATVRHVAAANGWYVFDGLAGSGILCVQRTRVADPNERGAETFAPAACVVHMNTIEVRPEIDARGHEQCARAVEELPLVLVMVRAVGAALEAVR